MPKLESANCPHCGARVHLEPRAEQARCEYCGITYVVQRGSRTTASNLPVIVVKPETNTKLALALGLCAVLVVGVIALVAITQKTSSKTTVDTGLPTYRPPTSTPVASSKSSKTSLQIDSFPVILADVNGDGRSQVIASVTLRSGSTSSTHLAMIDGASGELKAKTPALDSPHEQIVAVVGNRLVLANRFGEATAYDLASGDRQWTSSLGERVHTLCSPKTEGAVLAITEERRLRLDLVTGRQSETHESCLGPAVGYSNQYDPVDRRDPSAPQGVEGIRCGSVRVMGSQNYTVPDACMTRAGIDTDQLEGIIGHRLWRWGDGWLIFGVRKPGTYVPMVGRLAHRRLLWKTEVPAANPLEAEEGGPQHVALSSDTLLATYQNRRLRQSFLTAFAVHDGSRRFTVALPETLGSLRTLKAAADTIVVQGENGILLLEVSSGAIRATVGTTTR